MLNANGSIQFDTSLAVYRGALLIDIVLYGVIGAPQQVISYPQWAGRTVFWSHVGPKSGSAAITVSYASGYPVVAFPTFAEAGATRTAFVFVN
ncbi:hypothetical protein ACG02S_07760 [Roseateles sp. DC23W]|uniref:Uncharacterized protein n=1 Tax=Pelomonas dachongensis TaxID=3299029 RepID=A0ABW7EK99_9BURK